jgi:hypothetical protein
MRRIPSFRAGLQLIGKIEGDVPLIDDAHTFQVIQLVHRPPGL